MFRYGAVRRFATAAESASLYGIKVGKVQGKVNGFVGGTFSLSGAASQLKAEQKAIGNTPLIRLNNLSEETGCEILGKAELMNPGGSVKGFVLLRLFASAFPLAADDSLMDEAQTAQRCTS